MPMSLKLSFQRHRERVESSKQSASDHQGSFITSVCRKRTYTGLLTNYFSFTPFKYKSGLIKALIDRAYKINNISQGFHNDIKNF